MSAAQHGRPSRERALDWLRTRVLNRKVLAALVVASPAILASVSAFMIGAVIDDRLVLLGKQRDAVLLEMGQLDQFTKDFENKELLRTSFLMGLATAGAGDPSKYALDKLYRLDAAGSLRRIAAVIYPASWHDRVAGYDALVASDYRDPTAVQNLTASENEVIRDALARTTDRQAESNRLSEEIERLESRKTKLQSALNGLMYVLTVVVFFAKASD